MADTEWENINDSLFANPLKFDENTAETNILSAFISPGRKISKLIQSGIREKDVRSDAQNKNLPFHKEENDIELAFIPVLNYIGFPPRQSIQNRTKRVLYQKAYGPKLLPKSFEAGWSRSSANFVNLRITKSYKHMV